MDLSVTPQTLTNIEQLKCTVVTGSEKRKAKVDLSSVVVPVKKATPAQAVSVCSKNAVVIRKASSSPKSGEKIDVDVEVQTLQHGTSQDGVCPHCNKMYSNQSALKYHVRLVHSDMLNMFCCHLCPESFEVREFYKIHMWDVHNVRC